MRLSSSAVVELIRPVGLCFAAVLVTTSVLSTIDSFVPTEHLMLGYLLPTILVAIYFGSTLAVLTSFVGGLSAAYFLLPPKFSFYVDDPVHFIRASMKPGTSKVKMWRSNTDGPRVNTIDCRRLLPIWFGVKST